MTTVSLVAAVAENDVIGREGGLPWHLPEDLRRFKQLTMGHLLVMGRRTFASVGRELPGRRTVVLTRGAPPAPGIAVARSLDAALAATRPGEDVCICGGAAVYAAALPIADHLYLTRVHARVDGDTHFPPVDWSQWKLVSDEHHPADARHAYAMSFQRYDRR